MCWFLVYPILTANIVTSLILTTFVPKIFSLFLAGRIFFTRPVPELNEHVPLAALGIIRINSSFLVVIAGRHAPISVNVVRTNAGVFAALAADDRPYFIAGRVHHRNPAWKIIVIGKGAFGDFNYIAHQLSFW